jgi:hypothetical protein
MTNKIVIENQKAGTPKSEWDIQNASTSIEGFATEMSVNLGNTVDFKINTDSQDYRIEIYRLGYYDGDGARLIDSFDVDGSPTVQPDPIKDPNTGLVDAGNWSVSASWTVAPELVSGVYLAKLVREDGVPGENHIPFVVRDDSEPSDIVFKTADETWQAYNPWGDNNFYGFDDVAVSYNRPITTRTDPDNATPWNFVFGAEFPAIMWLEANGYDVSYIAGVDTARSPETLLDHKVYLSVGHDEYWSQEQRDAVEAARDSGVNLSFWSGNDVYWRSRWENSIDGSETAFRTLVTYKSTLFNRPDDPKTWTGTWRDDDFSGGQPENSLTGTIFMVDATPLNEIDVPYEMSQFRLWRNTDVADLAPGETWSLGPYLGYEWNDDLDNGFRPDGLVPLSRTVTEVDKYVYDEGASVGPGTSTHSLTLYRADSGALVFSAGSVMWSWGLNATHDPSPFGELPDADPNVQQAMVNLFADMGVTAKSLQPGLIPAEASTDVQAPTSEVQGANSVVTGQLLTLSGTATDAEGEVAVVEVSTDNGATWKRAEGGENWTFEWNVPFETGTYFIQTRAVDDSINLQENISTFFIAATGFSASGYLAANLDVAAAGIDPYQHYAEFGWREGRDASHLFDTERYLVHNTDVKEANLNPLEHFMLYGAEEQRPIYLAVGDNITEGFDAEYYRLTNRDVSEAGVDALQHFLTDGWREGRDPSAYFDTSAYLSVYTDVAVAGVNPLEHYWRDGWKEGRDPSQNFDTQNYLAANGDVAEAGINPLEHFLSWGALETRPAEGDGTMS